MKKALRHLKQKKKLCGARLSGYVSNLQRLRKLQGGSVPSGSDIQLDDGWVDDGDGSFTYTPGSVQYAQIRFTKDSNGIPFVPGIEYDITVVYDEVSGPLPIIYHRFGSDITNFLTVTMANTYTQRVRMLSNTPYLTIEADNNTSIASISLASVTAVIV